MVRRILSRFGACTLFAVVALTVLGFDRISKDIAVAALSNGTIVEFIPGVMDFRLVYNEGAAFGIFDGATAYFLISAGIISALILGYLVLSKRHTAVEVIALGLIFSGAIGNAIDRMTYGPVIDFFHTLFIDFPVFNVADIAITLGVPLFVIHLLFFSSSPLRVASNEDKDATTENGDVASEDPVEHEGDVKSGSEPAASSDTPTDVNG